MTGFAVFAACSAAYVFTYLVHCVKTKQYGPTVLAALLVCAAAASFFLLV